MIDGTNPIGQRTTAPVFNNLVMFDQHVKQNSLASTLPDLAVKWTWNEERTALTLSLRQAVKWHDGKPFTAKDMQCTLGPAAAEVERQAPSHSLKFWYGNLEKITTTGDYEVTFYLKRPEPAFLMLFADGYSAIYPCHVPAAQMRQHPIGTGPFKFVEFRPNEYIELARNPDYWKSGLPYLDGIEFSIINNMSTATLAVVSGKLDMTFP